MSAPATPLPTQGTKPWWLSKTLWANALAAIGFVTQNLAEYWILSAEDQATILAVANLILRIVTKAKQRIS